VELPKDEFATYQRNSDHTNSSSAASSPLLSSRVKTRLLVLSDLHLEFGPFEPADVDADVVVLAGDTNLGTAGVKWAQVAFAGKPVVYVAGNHEFYKHHWVKLLTELRAAAEGTNVHFLEDDSVVLNGVRFLGSTLWTDFELFGDDRRREAILKAGETMTDYKKIRAPRLRPGFKDDYAKLVPTQTMQRCKKTQTFLGHALDEPFDGPTVVVTHHLPSRRSVPARYADSLVSAAYASDLPETMVSKADVWVHGHAHESQRYTVGSARVLANPRGYRLRNGSFENSEFDPVCIVEV